MRLAAVGMTAALTLAPSAHATVLGVEGVAQAAGTTQTAFNNAFCHAQVCRSVRNPAVPWGVDAGARKLDAAVAATPGPVTVMGYSLGAAVVYEQLDRWADTDTAPEPADVRVVTFGNPNNKHGGSNRRHATPLPDVQPYEHLDVTAQYDNVADTPSRWGWYSMLNQSASQHRSYFTVDVDDPDNLVYEDENTTYMLIEADVLPMLRWRDWFTSDERMAELDDKYRPLVERDYDRPDYQRQGEGADWANGVKPEALQDAEAER